MPQYKHHGKNIKKIERVSGLLISDLALEATAFDSLHDYAVEFCKHYRCSNKLIRGIRDAIRLYAVEKYGNGWAKRYYEKGGQYLAIAGLSLGVPPDRVIEHLMTNDIDLAVFTKLYFGDAQKAYCFFFSRIERFQC